MGRTDKIKVMGLEGRNGTRVNIYRRSGQQSNFTLWRSPVVSNGVAVARWTPARQQTFVFMARIRQGSQSVETNYLRVSAEMHFT